MKYSYLTQSIPYSISSKKLVAQLSELLNEKAQEGWRLVKYDFSDFLGVCVVVFEKQSND
jgi:DNA gyrase/topoisomerase IV subunit A